MSAQQTPAPRVDHAMPAWLRDHLDSLAEYIEQRQPIAGLGVSMSQAPMGTVINAAPGGGTTAVETIPFRVVNASVGGAQKVRVFFGAVSVPPQGSYVPAGMSPGDDPRFIFDVSGNGSAVLIVTVDAAGLVNSVTIGEIASGTPIINTATTGHLVLGTWSTTAGKFSVVSLEQGAQNYLHCGGSHYFWT